MFINNIKQCLYCLLIFFIPLFATAQSVSNVNNIVPTSPEASALGRLNPMHTSGSTGAAIIKIPLFILPDKFMQMPIELEYATTGIKVDQVGSSVGMGWVANSTGVITRQVRGVPDEFATVRKYPPNDCAVTDTALWNYFLKVLHPGQYEIDAQPDLFFYHFGNYNGQFYLDSAGNAVHLTQSPLMIEVTLTRLQGYNCTITSPDGIKYFFHDAEKTYNEAVGVNCGANVSMPYINYVQTAAFLSDIHHPIYGWFGFSYLANTAGECFTGINQILQAYDPLYEVMGGGYQCSPNKDCPQIINSLSTCKNRTNYREMKLVRSITNSSHDSLVFDYVNRTDFKGGKLLKMVSLYTGGDILRKAVLDYKVIKSPVQTAQVENFFSLDLLGDTSLQYRYYLDEVGFYGVNNVLLKKYKLNYYDPEGLPNRLSFSQDHLGFYNGKLLNQSLLLPHSTSSLAPYLANATAQREPDSMYAIKGSLSSITYPTGGKDSLQYELHRLTENELIVNRTAINLNINTNATQTFKSVISSDFTLNKWFDELPQLQVIPRVIMIDGDSAPDSTTIVLKYKLHNVTTGEIVLEEELTANDHVNRLLLDYTPGHTYRLTLYALEPSVKGSLTLRYAAGIDSVLTVKDVPGIRVKKIITCTETGLVNIRRFYYARLNALTISSAAGYAPPSYFSSTYTKKWIICGNSRYTKECLTHAINSNSLINLYASSSASIHYRSIVESHGEAFENGAVERFYHVEQDKSGKKLIGVNNQVLYTGIASNWSFLNGVEYYTAYYKNDGGILKKTTETQKYYSLDSRLTVQSYGYEIVSNYEWQYGGVLPRFQDFAGYDVKKYQINSKWFHLDSSIEKSYEGDGALKKKVTFSYQNEVHQQPTETMSITSKGQTLIEKVKYADDYPALTGGDEVTAGVQKLQSLNIKNALVELSSWLQDGINQPKLTKATFSVYGGIVPLKKSVELLENGHLLSDFTPSSVVSGSIVKDKRYISRLSFPAYDNRGNTLEQNKINDVILSYIWDYAGAYPIAEVKNASSVDIAFTSFEAEGKGNWNYSGVVNNNNHLTGKRSYCLGGGNITKSGLNTAATYIVTLWLRTGTGSVIINGSSPIPILARNGWTLYTYRLAGAASVTISGTATIDELRLHPTEAQMKSFTFDPLIGVTSENDARNSITYYIYDVANRLKLIKDQNGNVLKKFSYEYKTANQ